MRKDKILKMTHNAQAWDAYPLSKMGPELVSFQCTPWLAWPLSMWEWTWNTNGFRPFGHSVDWGHGFWPYMTAPMMSTWTVSDNRNDNP